jgi:curved DNA binding protein
MPPTEEYDVDDAKFTISNPATLTKYKGAADIARNAISLLVDACLPGTKIYDLCVAGDNYIIAELGKVFTKGKIDKGIGFPTSISVNNCAGHYAPNSSDATVLAAGDLVKIDLGVHIDGYIGQGAHTFVCGQPADQPITGKAADLIAACHFAMEATQRLLFAASTQPLADEKRINSTGITKVIQKVADEFKVTPCEGVLSHEVKRYLIDGENCIANKFVPDQRTAEFEPKAYTIYTIDIVMSTGTGKLREGVTKTTIYKRDQAASYSLKMKAGTWLYSQIQSRFPNFPFTLHSIEDKKALLGITEVTKHGLVHPYPILYEKNKELVCQLKSTVAILPSGVQKLVSVPLPLVQSELTINDPELQAVLALPVVREKKAKAQGAATPAAQQ